MACPHELLGPTIVHIAVQTFPAAQLGYGVFTTQAFQYNADFFFGGVVSAGDPTNISNSLLGTAFLSHHHFLLELTMSQYCLLGN